MSGPTWLNWVLAGLMALCALYHGVRLATGPARRRASGYDVDLAHLLMCTAMAAMLVLTFGAQAATAWAVVVSVPALWFVVATVRTLFTDGARATAAPVHQVLMCSAMLFMLVAAGRAASTPAPMLDGAMKMPAMALNSQSGRDGGSSTSSMALTCLVLVALIGLGTAVLYAGRPRTAAPSPLPCRVDGALQPGSHASGLLLAPGLRLGAQLAMSATMIYMLVLLA